MIDMTAADEISSDARARSNVVRLAAAQALTGANSAVIFATGSIVGATLAPSVSLATVPISMYVVGLAAGTLADGRDLARLWPPRRLHHRHRLRRADRPARGLRDSARVVSAVLLRDVPWRPLWRGVAILSLCRRRWRQRRLSPQGGVVGDGRRRVRRRARPAARAVDDGYLAALSVRLQFCGAGDGGADRDGGSRRASMRRSPHRRICTAAVRCSRSRGSRGSSRQRCAASSPIP